MINKETKTIEKLKQYFNIYVFKINKEIDCKKTKNKDSWKDFLIPTKKKRENVSENIDTILYNQ